jgi:PglZ domain
VAGERVTALAPASLPVIRALLDEAVRKDWPVGVLGVRARPEWPHSPTFTYGDATVRVVPCESALAVREALLDRRRDQWLVVLTDRPDDDLGAGIVAHFIGNRLRTPDPWEAVRLRFAATGVDPALTASASHREIATALLAATPPSGWPPAPAGILTRDHALGAVAREHLGLADPVVDLTSVLRWTVHPGLSARLADLRELAGDVLSDAVLGSAAGRAGSVAAPLLHMLRAGEARDVVPLGLVAGLLADASVETHAGHDAVAGANAARIARDGLIRLEPRLGSSAQSPAAPRSWAAEAEAVIAELIRDPADRVRGETLLTRADEILRSVQAEAIADGSDLLPAGLTSRLAELAGLLRSAFGRVRATAHGPDDPQLGQADLAAAEAAWGLVCAHHLADRDQRTPRFHGAIRLARWLGASSALGPSEADRQELAAFVDRYSRQDAWADSAVNDAAQGVSDPQQSAALGAVLSAAKIRRTSHDEAFAAALAAATSTEGEIPAGPGRTVCYLEDLLPDVVLPLARKAPVLLLVLDGMSAGVCAEIVNSVLERVGDGWAEALLPGQAHRGAALAVLPTLTEVSRTSLLSGQLRTGGQDAERRGFEALWRAHGFTGAALFHKKPLDSTRPGYAIATDIAPAIADVTGQSLVACVLNTIDDALDRSDPGGTEWTAEAVRHLLPLLDRARYAGRVVILTADHGHVVERRQGTQRSYPEISSGRSRPAIPPAGDGEVLVTGQRVLLHDHQAVLAVDDQLRYGPLKAGYHGGAAAAEVVVPVVALVAGAVPEDSGLRLAPPQQPSWWTGPIELQAAPPAVAELPAAPAADGRLRSRPGEATPTLFDLPDGDDLSAQGASDLPGQPGATVAVVSPRSAAATIAAAVVASAAYASQKKIAGRLSVTDEQMRRLTEALLAAPAYRLSPTQAATALDVAPALLRGAILQAQQLLNVEGYAVLRVDSDGATVLLDEPLLREQFGVAQ